MTHTTEEHEYADCIRDAMRASGDLPLRKAGNMLDTTQILKLREIFRKETLYHRVAT